MQTNLPITDVLRNEIARSGISYHELERATGVQRQSIMRFMRKDQSLRLDIADKLVAYFGFKLVGPNRVRRKVK